MVERKQKMIIFYSRAGSRFILIYKPDFLPVYFLQ